MTTPTTKLPFFKIFIAICALIFLVACDNRSEKCNAYLQFALPSSSKLAGRSLEQLTETLSHLYVTVSLADGKQVSKVNALALGNSPLVEVPANQILIIKAEGLVEGQVKYLGETSVPALQPGISQSVSLLLYEIDSQEDALQIDIGIDDKPANGESQGISYSQNGQIVLFTSEASNLVENDINPGRDLFIRRLPTSSTINLHTGSAEQSVESNVISNVNSADISVDGQTVVFSSSAAYLVTNDSNEVEDVFIKNTLNNKVQRISLDKQGMQLDQPSHSAQISDDGTWIGFITEGNIDVVQGPGLYLYNRFNQSYRFISNKVSQYKLSGDASAIVYQSVDGGLYWQNLQSNIERAISTDNIDYRFNISQNGNFVVFIPLADGEDISQSQVYLFKVAQNELKHISLTLAQTQFTGSISLEIPPALSNDGRYVCFSYDNEIYVKAINTNNLLTLGAGNKPFLSPDGSRIGFEKDGKLFSINNPLYQPPIQANKALAPTGLSISSNKQAISLNWETVPDASYYRVYRTTADNIAELIEKADSSLKAYETQNNNLTIQDTLENEQSYYLAVVAVNQQGESALSEVVSINPEIDIVAPFVEQVFPESLEENVKLNASIGVLFSEAMDANTLDINNVKLLDQNDQFLEVELNYQDRSLNIIPLSVLQFNETYTIQLSTDIKDENGNSLKEPFSSSFTARQPVDEGSADAPKLISAGISEGMVGTGKSYYQIENLNAGADYIVRISSAQEGLVVNLSSFSFATPDFIPAQCTTPYCSINLGDSQDLFIEVDGSGTERGAAFKLEVAPIQIWDGSILPTFDTGLTIDNNVSYVALENLRADKEFLLVFENISSEYFSIDKLSDSSPDCRINPELGNLKYFCEAKSNSTGRIFLKFSGQKNISESGLFAQLNELDTISLEADFNSFPLENFFQPRKFLKFVNLQQNQVHRFEPPNIFNPFAISLYKDNWQTPVCDMSVIQSFELQPCFTATGKDNALYAEITVDGNSDFSSSIFITVNSGNIYPSNIEETSQLTLPEIQQEAGIMSAYHVVNGLEPLRAYEVRLSLMEAPFIDFSVHGSDWTNLRCLKQWFDSDTISCETVSDANGNIYLGFQYNVESLLIDPITVSVTPLEPVNVSLNELLTDQPVTPSGYFRVNNLPLQTDYLVSLSNIRLSPLAVIQPRLEIYHSIGFDTNLCVETFNQIDSIECIVNTENSSDLFIKISDDVSPLFIISDDTLVDIEVTPFENGG